MSNAVDTYRWLGVMAACGATALSIAASAENLVAYMFQPRWFWILGGAFVAGVWAYQQLTMGPKMLYAFHHCRNLCRYCWIIGTVAPLAAVLLGGVFSSLSTSQLTHQSAAYSTVAGLFLMSLTTIVQRLAEATASR
ncbi:MAG: hypothetical protein OJJ21_24300 [Ferrovibrio sp.]|uniref:hypothetical protein n=1 Tax=Ferrovibrio sp. TaxID=1917215 RepID=UPI002638992F|nr:hypothetical protein [Ferrovibrio sp.]MCW0236738.1 hypothetical protein [Ferrovibrio sp.]